MQETIDKTAKKVYMAVSRHVTDFLSYHDGVADLVADPDPGV